MDKNDMLLDKTGTLTPGKVLRCENCGSTDVERIGNRIVCKACGSVIWEKGKTTPSKNSEKV